MSNQITTANTRQYKSNVELLLQTKGSMLRTYVMEDTYQGEGGRPVNQIGQVVAKKKVTRHADTPLIETPHAARWVEPSDYEWADLIDDQDKLRTIIDPESPYAKNGAMALGRAIDEEIVTAFFATSKTGPQGGSTEAFSTANFQIAAAATGLTLAKLISAKQKLMGAKVDVRNDPLYIAVTSKQHSDLLNDAKIQSRDFNDRPVLVDGLITQFMGFRFIHLEELPLSGTDRNIPCWAKSGMHLGIWNDITTRISERSDKSYATQVYVKGTFGATRIEQGKVVSILCVES